MEGPTPVSALIHAATMVAAGVYMLCRVFFLVQPRPTRNRSSPGIGIITAVARRADRHPAERHQAHPRLFDALAARLHGLRRRPRRAATRRCSTSSPTPSSRRCSSSAPARSSTAAPRAGHLEDGRPRKNRMPITFLTFTVGTLALIGCPVLAGSSARTPSSPPRSATTLHLRARARHRLPHLLLHVPPDGRRLLGPTPARSTRAMGISLRR